MLEKNENSKRILFLSIFGGILFIVLLGVILYAIFGGKIALNPSGTVGNTAGNINNAGLFCEYNDKVYFSNPLDNGSLYSMNPDESSIKKMYSMKVRNLLAAGNYLYYFQLGSSDASGLGSITSTHSMNRLDLTTEKSVELTRDVVVSGQLVDNHLYLLTAGKEHPEFYKIKIDKSEKVDLANYAINPACAANSGIYYNGTMDDHALYRLNTENDTSSLVWNGNLWYPVLYGGYIYYMDVSANYRLCRYSLSDNVVEVLTKERLECFNVGSGYIYYQTNDAVSPQLKCMHTDGSNVIVVADGIYNNINMTSQYVYFQQFGIESSLFHSRLGSDQYSYFQY